MLFMEAYFVTYWATASQQGSFLFEDSSEKEMFIQCNVVYFVNSSPGSSKNFTILL